MELKNYTFKLDAFVCSIYVCQNEPQSPCDIIYTLCGNDFDKIIPEIKDYILSKSPDCLKNTAFVSFSPIDWNRDYSPWVHEAVFKNAEGFSGGGKKTLDFIISSLVPETEKIIQPRRRFIVGYSLGGLMSLWSIYKTDIFDGCGSCSGSLWFDGFKDFAKNDLFGKPKPKIYLSLGKAEEKTKNIRMKNITAITTELYNYYKTNNLTSDIQLDINTGGHFSSVPQRMAKSVLFLKK